MPGAGTAGVHAAEAHAAEEWAGAWFALSAREWRTLALVPAAPGASALALAERLAGCAGAYGAAGAGDVRVVDARGAAPGDVAALSAAAADHAAAGGRVLLVVASPLARAAAIPLARAADAALLVVPLGEAGVREARGAVAAVGHAHFLGSVTARAR